MDIGKAISFIFNDPDWWKKLLIGALILLIPIIGWIVLRGWWIEIIKRVAKDDPEPLPSFDNFGDLLISGFRSIVVQLAYKSPILILGSIALVPVFYSNFSPEVIIFVLCISLILSPLLIGLGLIEKSAQLELAIKGDLSQSFNFSKVMNTFRVSWTELILIMITSAIAIVITQPFATAFIIVGNLLVSVTLTAFSAHLYGQVYYRSLNAAPTNRQEPAAPPDDPSVITL